MTFFESRKSVYEGLFKAKKEKAFPGKMAVMRSSINDPSSSTRKTQLKTSSTALATAKAFKQNN